MADEAEFPVLMRPGEVAELFRVDPNTVTRWAEKGLLRYIRLPGGHRRFFESEVRSLFEEKYQDLIKDGDL